MTNFDLIQNRLDRIEAIDKRLEARANEERLSFQEYRKRNDAQMASLKAVVERLDAILDRLIRNQS